MSTRTKPRRGGRPPGGEDGARIQDYPRVMLRLPPATVARLKAWSHVRGAPVWRLIDESVNQAIDNLEGEDARLVRMLSRRQLEREQAGQ